MSRSRLRPTKEKEFSVISREDVMVYEGRDRDSVVDLGPSSGEHAALRANRHFRDSAIFGSRSIAGGRAVTAALSSDPCVT